MGLMALLNLYAILRFAPISFRLLDDYISQRKKGLDPVLKAETVKDLDGVECWDGSEKIKEPKLKTI